MTEEDVPQAPEDEVRMSIWDHLDELRTRVGRAGLALIVGVGVCWAFRQKLLAWLIQPFERAWVEQHLPGVPELQTLSPADIFVGYMQLSLTGGIICAIPVIFYQLWAFISPGLYAREKRFIVPFVVFSTLLFLSGAAFAHYVAFPFTFSYFLSLHGQVSEAGTALMPKFTLEFYLDFATRMLLAFGFVFELPILILFLAIAGLVTTKQLIAFSRWAVLLAVVAGAIVTPGPEITSQLAVSGALVCLYFISVGLTFFVGAAKKNNEDSDMT